MAKNRSKKSPRHFFRSRYFIYIFILISIIAGIIFLTRDDPAEAAASFYLSDVTPDEEVRRGGPLVFDVMVQGQTAGSAVNTGIEFDKRKLRLDSIDSGVLGTVTWETIADNGNNSRVVIHNTNISAGDNQQFARVNFTIIDETDERDAQGRGFVELCTIFDPEIETPPTPQDQPTNVPQATVTQTINTVAPTDQQNTPIPTTNQNMPTPTSVPTSQLDTSKLCMPFRINGSPADKMDFIMIPMNYPDYNRFVEQAHLALNELDRSNLSEYREEVLDKTNWYLLNTNHPSMPAQYRGRPITNEEVNAFLAAAMYLCPNDRWVFFADTRQVQPDILGMASPGNGLIFGGQGLYQNENTFAHEWGHAAAHLDDEYIVQASYSESGSAYYNCTNTPNNSNPDPDPCIGGVCQNENDAKYQKACPKWDCTQVQCDELQRELFQEAGCYKRCSSPDSYRSAPISIMDSANPIDPEYINKFNPPSLYSIIQFTFSRYR